MPVQQQSAKSALLGPSTLRRALCLHRLASECLMLGVGFRGMLAAAGMGSFSFVCLHCYHCDLTTGFAPRGCLPFN